MATILKMVGVDMLRTWINQWQRKGKCLVVKLLRIQDKTHSIAMGFTLGFLINFIPSFGFGPVLSVATARLFRGNTIAAFLGGISVIWAFPLLFYFNIVVGQVWLPEEPAPTLQQDDFVHTSVLISQSFMIGMVINVMIFGFIVYFFTFALISRYRQALLRYIHKSWLPKNKNPN
ncbi:DUF2062 domain-containing protein [Caldalkalibacillus salinus]|uniref:DUF2062 domain-containing protein n=1 Tax=Caldalkalibacillus salinus TaxID=2803787 RepID=UPI0019229C4B|nr:DUF2062 domain-containing protein [Caldalkalibacillus salinus]